MKHHHAGLSQTPTAPADTGKDNVPFSSWPLNQAMYCTEPQQQGMMWPQELGEMEHQWLQEGKTELVVGREHACSNRGMKPLPSGSVHN